ncbi:MAG: hypothetical protein Q4C01_03345 [Clostridia bacterium]|nr:hypothetical protein [Clostridia bacterium]
MKRLRLPIIALMLCMALCACSNTRQEDKALDFITALPSVQADTALPLQEPDTPKPIAFETSEPEPSALVTAEPEIIELIYPFEDAEGRIHHRIYINGELVETAHDAYTYPSEPNGAYYPIVEILEHLGVECLFDEHLEALTTRVNGQVITCKTDKSDIVIGSVTLGGTSPEYIDGCFYVPSYTFMRLLDAVVDFTPDRSGVTISTDITIDAENSGTRGLSISTAAISDLGESLYSGAQACPTCGGTGRAICTSCSGTGSPTQYVQVYDPVCGGSGKR